MSRNALLLADSRCVQRCVAINNQTPAPAIRSLPKEGIMDRMEFGVTVFDEEPEEARR